MQFLLTNSENVRGRVGRKAQSTIALRHLPWLCCFLGALQWHRSCEDRSAVCRWSTASGVVPSQRAPRRLTIACWKSWSTNKSLLYLSVFLFVGAGLNDNPLGWVDRGAHYQVPVRIAIYGKDWNWKGQCTDDMLGFTCQYQSCAPVALCFTMKGKKREDLFCFIAIPPKFGQVRNLGGFTELYTCQFSARVAFNWQLRNKEEWKKNLAWLLTLPWTRIFTQCWWYE